MFRRYNGIHFMHDLPLKISLACHIQHGGNGYFIGYTVFTRSFSLKRLIKCQCRPWFSVFAQVGKHWLNVHTEGFRKTL